MPSAGQYMAHRLDSRRPDMQRLDDATAQMTFLAMVADLQRAWQVHLNAPDDYFDVIEQVIVTGGR